MRIRPAAPADSAFIDRLAPRLLDFGTVPGRDPDSMVARDREVLAAALQSHSIDDAVFVADDDEGTPLGFIHLTLVDDYYTNTETGHVADIVVAPEAAGRGVGSALMAFAEDWAKKRGLGMLTLSVFPENVRARSLYRRLGFREDWIRCVKRL